MRRIGPCIVEMSEPMFDDGLDMLSCREPLSAQRFTAQRPIEIKRNRPGDAPILAARDRPAFSRAREVPGRTGG